MSGHKSLKHASGLSIGYNGSFLHDSTKEKCGRAGVVLTRGGRIFIRDTNHDPWDDVATPSIFYFHDNGSDKTYLVDKNKKSISQTELRGHVLDCTDRTIYEVKDCEWSPVCDLSSESTKTIVRCSHLSTGLVSSRQVSLKLLKEILDKDCDPVMVTSLPDCDLTIPFDVLGCNAEVLCEFSEIDPDLVDLCNGFLNVEAIPPGECATLIYETCVCDEKVIVAHLFIRDPVDPRFSAKCGQFVPPEAPVAAAVAVPFPNPLCPEPDLSLTPILSEGEVATNLYQLQDWALVYQVPEGQFSTSGGWTVPKTGDYEVKAEIHLCSQPILRGSVVHQLSYFILVRYPVGSNSETIPGVIEVCVPITIPLSVEDRLESAHASIDTGLRLTADDLLMIYYVENVTEPTLPPQGESQNRGYRTVRCATTFSAHFLGCAPVLHQ